jgi:hypothetical protein
MCLLLCLPAEAQLQPAAELRATESSDQVSARLWQWHGSRQGAHRRAQGSSGQEQGGLEDGTILSPWRWSCTSALVRLADAAGIVVRSVRLVEFVERGTVLLGAA